MTKLVITASANSLAPRTQACPSAPASTRYAFAAKPLNLRSPLFRIGCCGKQRQAYFLASIAADAGADFWYFSAEGRVKASEAMSKLLPDNHQSFNHPHSYQILRYHISPHDYNSRPLIRRNKLIISQSRIRNHKEHGTGINQSEAQ